MVDEAVAAMKRRLVNCAYLQDTEVTVFGLKVYGSPWWASPLVLLIARMYTTSSWLLAGPLMCDHSCHV